LEPELGLFFPLPTLDRIPGDHVLERGSPFIFPEVGIYVPLCPVEADLSGGILKRYRTGAMPARSESVSRARGAQAGEVGVSVALRLR